jgi:hypothetical protein
MKSEDEQMKELLDRMLNYKFLRLPADRRLEIAVDWGIFSLELSEKIDVEIYQGFLQIAKDLGLSERLLKYIEEIYEQNVY